MSASLSAIVTKLECALEALDCVSVDKGGRPPSDRGRLGAHQHVRVWVPRSVVSQIKPSFSLYADTIQVLGEWSQKSDPNSQKGSRNDFLDWCALIECAVIASDCCTNPVGMQVDRTEDGAWLRLRITITNSRQVTP